MGGKPEPYTPVSIEEYKYNWNVPDVPQYVTVRYYTYEQKGITWRIVEKGKDELDTYLRVVKVLNQLKKRADKRREKKEQTNGL